MIPNQWYVVLDSCQLKKRPVAVVRMGERLVFWRDKTGKAACFRDCCPHRGASLGMGKLKADHIQCPFHGLEFNTEGKCVLIPANGRKAPVPERFAAHVYPVYENHGFIWIWWGCDPPTALQPPRFFDDIDGSFSCGKLYDEWHTHYSRVIENQLDVMHLPFVHYNTIGRGSRTLVDGPGLEVLDADRFRVYVYNRLDKGGTPRKPDEVPVPDPGKSFHLEFLFPNLWENHISEKVRIVIAFVPIDEERTIVYLRFYQKFLRMPGLRGLVNLLSLPLNRYILHQDRRVVEGQSPEKSSLKGTEQLVQGDHPVVHYRRRRQALLDIVS